MTEKSTEESTFPENRHNAVFEVIRHENLQKGRNEGRPKTVKKTSKKVEKLTCPLFSWLRVPETTVFIVFSAPLKN